MRISRSQVYFLLLAVILVNACYLALKSYDSPQYIAQNTHEAKHEQVPSQAGSPSHESSTGQQTIQSQQANTKSGVFKETFNQGQWPRRYKEGMGIIRNALLNLVQVTPGIDEFTEDDFWRDINNDADLRGMGDLPLTSSVLGLYLQMSEESVDTLKKSHRKALDQVLRLDKSKFNQVFGGRGIVMTGGGKYFPMALSAIHWIRDTNKDIPIEVFMSDESEYEKSFCEGLFPKINVECRVVKEVYGDEVYEKLKSKYALKPLAILASKFDHIYFMDVDSYPLSEVDRTFESSVYEEFGYLLHSDYWPRYISPHFYEVIDVKLGGRVRGKEGENALLQSDREGAFYGQSTESGQIFVHKSTHLHSLLLATYYNLYGPNRYFTLLTMRGPGEGDKDTYIVTAQLCNEKFYQTKKSPVTLGYFEDGQFNGVAMIQPDVSDDHSNPDSPENVGLFAMHSNYVKANAKYMFGKSSDGFRVPKLSQRRFFGSKKDVNGHGLPGDPELRLFDSIAGYTCDWAFKGGYIPNDWKGENVKRLCTKTRKHADWLRTHLE